MVAALPITVPAFVTSYSWVSVTPAVQGFAGATMIVTLAYYPLVYLPVAAVLRGTDPALEESARSMGLGPLQTFWRVTLPQTRVALLGGSLLVAIHTLAEFGAFSMLRFQTFTTAIYDQYRLSFNGPAASTLATVLVLMCLVLLIGELRLRGRDRYHRIGSGSRRPALRAKLGRLKAPVADSAYRPRGGKPRPAVRHPRLLDRARELDRHLRRPVLPRRRRRSNSDSLRRR